MSRLLVQMEGMSELSKLFRELFERMKYGKCEGKIFGTI